MLAVDPTRRPTVSALDDVLPRLTCPVCGGGLVRAGGSVRCPDGHAFDIARQGYLNLLAGGRPPATGDTPGMVRAREEFAAAGHLATLERAVAEAAADAVGHDADGLVVDAGAGLGRHLAAVLDRLPAARGLALDVSKHAARRAARAHDRAAAVVWDTWRPWPVRDGCATLVLDVLAPRNPPEFARVLRPDGALVVATPTAAHLAELVGPLGLLDVDPDKESRLAHALGEGFVVVSRRVHTARLRLDADDVARLVRMGPSAHHLDDGEIPSRVARLEPPVTVTAQLAVAVHRPAGRTASTRLSSAGTSQPPDGEHSG